MEIWGPGLWGPGLWGAADSILVFDGLTTYYINLLIIQYCNKPKARATVGILVRELVSDQIIAQVRDGFNLEVAVGSQLDTLASYRGAQRIVFGIDLTRDYFALPSYDDADLDTYHGIGVYAEDPSVYFMFYADTNRPSYAMTDDELRRLVKLLAKTQSRFLSVKEVDDILWAAFGAMVTLQDNEDMTIEYVHDPSDTDTLYKIAAGVGAFPHPSGVEVITS